MIRTMLRLMNRELESSMSAIALGVIIVGVAIIYVVFSVVVDDVKNAPLGVPLSMITALWGVMFVLPLVFACVGVGQMYSDRTRKISTFLSTLATTRRQIMTAKMITGIAIVVAVLALLVITDVVLLIVFPRMVPLDLDLLIRMFVSIFFASLACYAVGLQLGWSSNKFVSSLGVLIVSIVLMSVILLKGFSPETWLILALVTAASLARTWQKFMSTPL